MNVRSPWQFLFDKTFAPVVHFAVLLAILTAGSAAIAADVDVVEAYLVKLGLIDLQILHLEQAVADEPVKDVQLRLARRLADLYADRLLNLTDDAFRLDDVSQRINALLERMPAANTTAIQITLLQADYRKAEALMLRWQEDPVDEKPRTEAAAILERISPLFIKQQHELNVAAAKLSARVDKEENKDTQTLLEGELRREQIAVGRATYFAGWTNYYWGLSGERNVVAKRFADARDAFRKLLEIEGETPYKSLSAETLGLESIWRSRAALGLGLVEFSLGNATAGEEVFKWLDASIVSAAIRDQLMVWKLQGFLNARQLEAAESFANDQVARFSGQSTAGRINFCVALVRTGYARNASRLSEEEKRLGDLGIRGLAKLRQFNVLRQLMTKYKFERTGHDFFLTWIQGQQLFATAEKSKNDADFEQAAKVLSDALGSPDAKVELFAAGECRGTLAWCFYRQEKYEKAASEFRQAAEAIKVADANHAADNGWMVFVSYQHLASKSPQFRGAAVEALETLKRNFPKSSQAKKADYQIAKLRHSAASPDELLRWLEQVKANDPDYLQARFDICLIAHQRWSKTRQDKEANAVVATAASEFITAADRFLRDAASDSDRSRKLKVGLLAAEVCLSSPNADAGRAKGFLDRVAAAADAESHLSLAAAEYYYRRLQVAQMEKSEGEIIRYAEWLAKYAQGSPYELSALVIVARRTDLAVQGAEESEKLYHRKEGAAHYGRLVELLGDSTADLASKKNAQVACSKLAQYQADIGDYTAAGERLEKLIGVFPHDRGYLRRAGIAWMEAGKYAAALDKWRTLLGGVEKGSNDWFEAKYFQIFCLAKMDNAMAKTVFAQFKLLHPELGPSPWREKFIELERTFAP